MVVVTTATAEMDGNNDGNNDGWLARTALSSSCDGCANRKFMTVAISLYFGARHSY